MDAGETHDMRQDRQLYGVAPNHGPSTYTVAEHHPLWVCSAPIGRVKTGERRTSIGGPDQPGTVCVGAAGSSSSRGRPAAGDADALGAAEGSDKLSRDADHGLRRLIDTMVATVAEHADADHQHDGTDHRR